MYSQANVATLLQIVASDSDVRARFEPLGTAECAAAAAAAFVRAAEAEAEATAAAAAGGPGAACDAAVRRRVHALAGLLMCVCCVPGGDAQVIATAAAVVHTPGEVEALLRAGLVAAALQSLDDRVSPLKCLVVVASGIKRADGHQGDAERAAVAAWVRVATESAGLAADALCESLAEAGPRAELAVQLALHLTTRLRSFEPVARAVAAAVAARAARFFPLLAAAARRPGAALGLQEDLWEALLGGVQDRDQAMAAACCPETVGALLSVLASARAAQPRSAPSGLDLLAAAHKASALGLQGVAAEWLAQMVVLEHKIAPLRRSVLATAPGAAAALVGGARAALDAAAAAAAVAEGRAPSQGSKLAANVLWTMAAVGVREVGVEASLRPSGDGGGSSGSSSGGTGSDSSNFFSSSSSSSGSGSSSSNSRESSGRGSHAHDDGSSSNWMWLEALQRFSAVPLAVRALEMPQLTLSGDAQVIAAAAAVVNTPGAVEALLQAGLAAAALENLDDRVSPLKCLSAVATGIKRADGQQGEAESAAVAAWVRVMTESAGLAADVLCDCLAEAGPRAELGMQLALHLTCILRTFEPVAMAVTAAVALRAARFFPLLAAAARRPGAALGLQEDLDGCSCGGNSSSSSRETSSSGKHVHNNGTSGNWAWFEALQRFSAVPLAVRALEMPQLTLSQKTDAAFLLAALVYGQQRRQQEQEQEQERGAGGASGNAASTDACLADGGDAAALRSRAWAVLAEAMLKGWGLTEVQWLCGFSHTFRNELAAAPGALAAVAAILLNPQTSQSDAALALQLIDELEVWAAWRWQLDGRDNRDRSRVSSGGGGSSGSGSKGGGFSGRGMKLTLAECQWRFLKHCTSLEDA
ncbi:hypothetical protein MNEG_4523 [Monoraphidium neglectum]|uniref:Uncharacterized protein n=1 Tax=Monoraphidium neglectum TaxID=145388 RepID=A0A0D2MKG3_9CHLO|nr:hypothetical protein MNEG_4523 [Monoraphidium neglectum]KIZ03440.1 hypothetical protein MNEG_4523 [Monoraphidium neglectum]|eukprot:XP_013902459.1 hypothetical protein MNEG_4523 [Monoraphidium neglectum]